MKLLIADLIVEITPKYEYLKNFAQPFFYDGTEQPDISLTISDEHLNALQQKMKNISLDRIESFAYSSAFNRAAIKHNTMLVHSSAVVYNGGAYLFSALSGGGKSTHTALWKKAFGDDVKIINDDKPVVQIKDNKCTVYGTPFDGGSGIANNDSAPLKAIIFIEKGEENSIRIPTTTEVLQNLYFSTAHMVDKETAEAMILNFEKLISLTQFYVLTCNTDISAAYFCRDAIVKQQNKTVLTNEYRYYFGLFVIHSVTQSHKIITEMNILNQRISVFCIDIVVAEVPVILNSQSI